MKKFLLAALASVFVCVAQAQTQEKTGLSKTTKEKGSAAVKPGNAATARPDDFPKYVDTGNPEADRASYYAAKKAWMDSHNPGEKKPRTNPSATPAPKSTAPKTYNNGQIKTIQKADFDKMPEEKKQHILSHPERYIVK